MPEHDRGPQLRDLGPLDVTEPSRVARLRFHQAWYRVEVLKLIRYGSLPAPSSRRLGSVLDWRDASQGKNFLSKQAHELYDRRRFSGWGLDPVRCLSIMTSSQALSLNLFGPLFADLEWCGRILDHVLELDEGSVEVYTLWIEFAPADRSNHLGDRTLIDICGLVSINGATRVLAIEVKLADRYVSRVLGLGDLYSNLATSVDIWTSSVLTKVDRLTNQLFRVHALAASLGRGLGLDATPLLMLLHHPRDLGAAKVSNAYSSILADPRALRTVTLDKFLSAMKLTAASASDRSIVDILELRYVDLERSETFWLRHEHMLSNQSARD